MVFYLTYEEYLPNYFVYINPLSLFAIAFVSTFQIKTQNSFQVSCSYFDPQTIDFLAFGLSLFLIVEGSHRIYEHKKDSLKKQLSRSIRIMIGCGIFSLHIIQYLHKF